MDHPRRLQVLQAIVEDYVHSREPVGSKRLVERHGLGVSSATVRNDMAALEEEGLIEHAVAAGEHLVAAVEALQHPLVTQVRGAGLLRAIGLARPIAPAAALVARRHGVIVNPVAPDALRLAPPLTITTDQLSSFVDALPAILDEAAKESA